MQNNDGLNLMYGHMQPQATDIESAIIGLLMLDKSALDTASKMLAPECLYEESNQLIYQTILELDKDSQTFELLAVVERLRKKEILEKVGGVYHVTKLTNEVVNAASIEQYCRIVYEKYLLREQIKIYGEGINRCYQAMSDGFEVLDQVPEKLITLANKTQRGEVVGIDTALVESVRKIEELRHNKRDITGITTGFISIDKVTFGWQAPDLIILAARPSVGKTAFALNLARNAAICGNVPTAFFSLEMSTQQVVHRLLAAESSIPLEKIQRGKLEDSEMVHLYTYGVQRLAKAPLFFDDTAALNHFELRAKARRLKNSHKIGLIIVDYLQLMSSVGTTYNREQEISQISRSLKALAKELNIPIIALSQLSREVEKRANGKPQLSDLRESGAIEQDADMVAFLTRPDYQKEESEVDPALQNLVDMHIKKSRNGALETIPLKTNLSIMKFFEDDGNYKTKRPGFIPLSQALKVNGYHEREEQDEEF